MDFELEWHQEELKRTARSFLERKCSVENLLAAHESEAGFSMDTYREMGELGWFQLGLRGDHGGSDDLIDALVLFEEFGRAALGGPHFVSAFVAAPILADLDVSNCHADLLADIISGQRIATIALYEETGGYTPESVQLTARQEGQQFKLNGQKFFVPYAHAADHMMVLARTGVGADELSWFIVPREMSGLELELVDTVSGEKQGIISFGEVSLPAEALLGLIHGGWAAFGDMQPRLSVLQAAELVGLMERAFEMALDYSRERVAFGRPIGAFQAIQHKCADMVTDRDAARFLTYQAACLINEGRMIESEVSMAKAFAAEAARRVTKEAHQIYAGAGYITQNRLHFYYRRAKGIELLFGDTREQLNLVAERWLG